MIIVSMSPPSYPSHGCIPAEPASVSPGQTIVFSGGLLATQLPLPARLFEFAVAGGMDFRLSACEHIAGCHKSDRAVQAHRIVVIHIVSNQPTGILRRQWCPRPNTFPFVVLAAGRCLFRYEDLLKLADLMERSG